jgi:hypothetical protein
MTECSTPPSEEVCSHASFVESKNIGCIGRTVRECETCRRTQLKHEGTGWESTWATWEELIASYELRTPPHMRKP